ncbi:Ig-like domain-containing protein [Vibrio astriarenae]
MNYKWSIIPLALAILGCSEDKDKEPTPVYRNFTISGDVFGEKSNQGLVSIRTGNNIELGSVIINQQGQYTLPVEVENSLYQQMQNENLYLISNTDGVQLANYLDLTLREAVNLVNLSGNLSSLTTSQYVVADANNDGFISAQEWANFSSHSASDTVNSSVLQFSSSLQTVLEGLADEQSSGSLNWLGQLKSSSEWASWSELNQAALDTVWSLLFEDPLASEAESVLDLGNGVLEDWIDQDDVVLGDKPARCAINIAPPSHVDPSQGRVGDKWTLSHSLVDQVTGIAIESATPNWTSINPNVASVTANGQVSLNTAGSTSITGSFSYGGDSCLDTLNVTVFEHDEIVELVDVRVSVDTNQISIGEQVRLNATAYWSNDTASDVSSTTQWTVEPANHADLDGQWLIGLKAGNVVVRAEYEGKTDTTIITILPEDVTPPELESLTVTGYVGPKKSGESWQLNAIGDYDDESSRDLTHLVTWSSSNSNVASVMSGIVLANSPGSAEIAASFEGITTKQTVLVLEDDVVEPEIVAVRLVGDSSDKYVGDSWNLSAVATYDDDEEFDVTSQVQWTSSNNEILTVYQGSVEAISEGTGVISIRLQDFTDSQQVTVQAYEAELTEVKLNASESSIVEGNSIVWTATANYDDDSELDISRRATWSSSDETVATVVGGVITAMNPGSASISVSFEDKEDTAQLTVESASVESISIDGGTSSIRVGQSTSYTATANYNNGTEVDITDSADWTSESETHAVSVSAGTVTGLNVGNATIKVSFDGENATSDITVTTDAPQVVGVTIEGDTSTIEQNQSRQLQAKAAYGNDSSMIVIAEWESSDSDTLSVNPAGVLTANKPGKATITARFQGVESSQEISVVSDVPVLESLEIIGDVSHFRKGDTLQLIAKAHFDRGDSQDVTQEVDWRSTNSDVVSVEHGYIEGITPGQAANIIIEWEDERDNLFVQVNVPDVESIEPSIFNNEMTMVEGEVYNGKFTLTLSDGTKLDYSDEATYRSFANVSDDSGLKIADELNDGFRAYRAGNTSFQIRLSSGSEATEHLRYAGIEVTSHSSYDYLNVDLEVKKNPDTYMWHRINAGIEENYNLYANIIYDNKVYQFWNHAESGVLKGIYVSHFDGVSSSEPKLILEGLELTNTISREFFDGGGNGFILLKVRNANRITDQYIYDIESGESYLIDFSTADNFDVIDTQNTRVHNFTGEGLLNYHRIEGSNSTRTLTTHQYNPKTESWSVIAEHSLGHNSQKWIQTVGQNESLVLLDTNNSTNSSAGYKEPELQFYSRETGELTKVLEFVYPLPANTQQNYCTQMTYSSGRSFQLSFNGDKVSAYCKTESGNNSPLTEVWLWDDITKYPEVIHRDELERWENSSQLNIVKDGDTLIGFGSAYKDSPGNIWREIHEWDMYESTINTVSLERISSRTVDNSITNGSENYDVSNLSIRNPHADNELLVLAYGTMIVVDKDSGKYSEDINMYGLPISIGQTNRLFNIEGTWYIFGGSNSYSQYNYFWRLQLRNPEAEIH